MANVADLFFAAARKHPTRIALVNRDDTRMSFGELAERVEKTKAYYQAKGIQKGDRVLLLIPMSIDLYAAILALFSLGATIVFLDEWVSRERLNMCCKIARCKAFIAPFKIRAAGWLLSSEIRKIPIGVGPAFRASASVGDAKEVAADDLALITFTTGSTGIPKAALRTHGILQAQFDALVEKIAPQETDVDMPVLPIVLLLNLGTGVTSVIADYNSRKPLELNPQRLVQQIQQHGVNRLTSSPYVLKRLAEYCLQQKNKLSFRSLFTGGAPVFPDDAQLFTDAFPNATTTIVYGSTEAEPISSIDARELIAGDVRNLLCEEQTPQTISEQGLLVGFPYRLTDVRILPITEENIVVQSQAELDAMHLSAGKIGEIVVRGPHVLKNYLDNPEAELRNKIYIHETVWHRTGDSGFLNNAGQLFLCGRCSTLILSGEKYLVTFVAEYRLAQHPDLIAGTVLQEGNQTVAVVQAKPNADLKKIREEILEKMYAGLVHEIYFVSSIPRDPRHFSKIDYGKLREDIAAGKFTTRVS